MSDGSRWSFARPPSERPPVEAVQIQASQRDARLGAWALVFGKPAAVVGTHGELQG